MITILNRKELIITYSLEKQAKVRNLLSSHKIDYAISSTGNIWQSNVRGMGINVSAQTEYKIYVKKADYQKAVLILNENL